MDAINQWIMPVAIAQGSTAAKAPSMFEFLLMPAALLIIMYLFMIRPQQTKAKELAKLISNLKAGDEIITTAGIIAKVKSIADTFITVEIGNNATMKLLKTHVGGLTK